MMANRTTTYSPENIYVYITTTEEEEKQKPVLDGEMGVTGGAAAAAPPVRNVFVYGTLMAVEVVHVLLGRVPTSSRALLHHYNRHSIRGRTYPAIVPLEGHTVSGKVMLGLSDHELAVLDSYEASEYEREEVTVTTTDSSKQHSAYTYVWGNHSDPDLYGDWNFEEWRPKYIESCVEMTNEFMEDLEQLEPETGGSL